MSSPLRDGKRGRRGKGGKGDVTITYGGDIFSSYEEGWGKEKEGSFSPGRGKEERLLPSYYPMGRMK